MPTRASLSNFAYRLFVFCLIISTLLFTTLRLANLVQILLSSTPPSSIPRPATNIPGHWRETLDKLGIEPFKDALQPDVVPFSRPETNLRFDLRKRKRAFSLPTKSNLYFSGDLTQDPTSTAQKRRMLEKELQAFKKIHNDFKRTEAAKHRMQKKHSH